MSLAAGASIGDMPQPPARATMPLASIQSARGIAALLVAAFHLSILMSNTRFGGEAPLAAFTWWGYRGVDFFFVLSGFIILLAHRGDIGRRERLGRYAWKRASRIYPAYWLYTAVVLAISAGGAGVVLARMADPSTILSTVTLIRFGEGEPPVGVAWTLFHELIFYAAFAALVIDKRLGVAVFLLWGSAILIAGQFPTAHSPLGTLVGSYNANFFFGMGAYVLHRRLSGRGATLSVVAGLAALAAVLWLEARSGGSLAIHYLSATAFALLIAGAAAMERSGRRMTFPGLALLGNASYSLYLTHVTMQFYMAAVLARLGLFDRVPGIVAWLLLLAGTVVAGLLAYRFVERPLLALARRHEPGRTDARR